MLKKKGFVFVLIFLLLINIPLMVSSVSGSIETTLYVDSYSLVYNNWVEVGSSPYLNEGTGNYIWTETIGHAEGKFSFENITQEKRYNKTITSIEMKIFAGHNGETDYEYWVVNAFTGSSGTPYYFAQFLVSNSTQVVSSTNYNDAIATFNTTEKINNIEFSLVTATSPFGEPKVFVYEAWLVVNYSVEYGSFDWFWIKWLLALTVFIIIISFAIYVKGGRR